MIEVDGVMVPRVLMTELADRLIHKGELESASRVLHGLAHGPSIELTDRDRSVLCDHFPTAPGGLEHLWRVICPEPDSVEGVPVSP